MHFKKRRAFLILDIILSIVVGSVAALIVLGLLSSSLSHLERYSNKSNAWQKGTRLLLLLDSRLVNAGLGLPKDILVRDIFRSGTATPLPYWNSAIEVLDAADNPVIFQNIDGDEVATGTRLRVLSTTAFWSGIDITSVRVASADFEWQSGQRIELAILKSPKMSLSGSATDPSLLSTWLTIPSLGVPFVYENSHAPHASTRGSLTARNVAGPLEWGGVDMLFAFRFAYFFADEGIFFIRDSDRRDRINDTPARYPVENGVSEARFEFNKTQKILKAWLTFGDSTVVSGVWRVKNF